MKITDIRKTVTESSPVYAAVGATDLAVGALRIARADLTNRAFAAQSVAKARVEAARTDLAPAKIQAGAQNLPNVAITKTLEAAGRAEETYSQLTSRGKAVVGAARRKATTKELLAQAKSTRTLGKAAVTTVRKATDETRAAAKATVTVGRREIAGLVGSATHEVEAEVVAAPKAAKAATKGTRTAVKRTTTTAKTRAARTTKATKAVRTSARKTAVKSAAAAKGAAGTLGR